MKLSLGFSPCPNDTFIFDALVNNKIDTMGLDFDAVLADVETLNQWALQGKLDISKISFGVWPLVSGHYHLLDAGGALGKGVGPLLISRNPIPDEAVNLKIIAIPGEHTTANLLFSLVFPGAKNKRFMVFSDIEDAVLAGRVDCGVIIHENRFTYRQKGLIELADLGQCWEERTGCPIPLGGIVINPSVDPLVRERINLLIKTSIEYAWGHCPDLPDYVRRHAKEMDEQVMRKHIDLYVNNYSLSLGEEGRRAVETLLRVHAEMHP
jgi:1,4-dihydroxy-6-naphthoate synthase